VHLHKRLVLVLPLRRRGRVVRARLFVFVRTTVFACMGVRAAGRRREQRGERAERAALRVEERRHRVEPARAPLLEVSRCMDGLRKASYVYN
jgi:hypothetical protein